MDVNDQPIDASRAPTSELTSGNATDEASDLAQRLSQILLRIEAQTSAALPPKKWGFLGTEVSVRQLSCPPDALVASLVEEFGADELCAEGVLLPSSTGEFRLSRIFGDAASSFVFHRDATNAPVNVVSPRGYLASANPDWLRLAAERADASGFEQPILLACSDAELLLFHRLGLNYTPAQGLRRISGKRVHDLFAVRAAYPEARKFSLALVGWQLAECVNQPAPETLAMLSHIADIRAQYNLDPASVFRVWLPMAAEHRLIHNAIAFRDPQLVATQLRRSLRESCFTPSDALTVIQDRATPSYGVAFNVLTWRVTESRLVPLVGEVRVALAQLERAYFEAIGKNLRYPKANNGLDALRSIACDRVASQWFQLLPIVVAAKKIIAGEFPDDRDNDRLIAEQLRLVAPFAALYRLRPPG